MRAILISVAILLMSGSMLAQQRRQPTIVQRTFVPDEPLPCIAFNRMADRLDAVYKTEEISKSDYDEGMKKYKRSEEHTSELQSRLHLVCRLLLEKKKTARP